MNNATGKINVYALKLEDAQTEIREIIKQAFMKNEPYYVTWKKLNSIIAKAVKDIKIDRLKRDAIISLTNFANVQNQLWRAMGISPLLLVFLGLKANKSFTPNTFTKSQEKAVTRQLQARSDYPTSAKGVPLQKFYNDVWYKDVKPTLDKLCETVALDPNDFTGRNSLRNLAEMEVRYKDHQDNIEELKKSGAKIVQCSAHEDCSDRCYPWQQQRLYSLDGTYGVIDGMKYIPLEIAVNVPYTTKAGRVYMNGLLGFNCRHKLSAYNGELSPTVSAKKRAIEYNITKKQRTLEREVRKLKVKAEMLKGINIEGYKEAKEKAKQLYEKYKKFSHNNERAYYPMRVRI